jgi:hypothetical protein
MAAALTQYERVVAIITREQKKALINHCAAENLRMTQVFREALKMYAKKKGFKL